MRYNGTEEEVTLFRRGLSRSCEPSFQGGRGRMARPGPRWTGTGTGIEQWSVVDGSMGWQRTAQRTGNTGVPCGGQMEGLEGLGGVTQPGGAWLPVFARPAKKLASRAVGTCREGRCPFSRPRSSASCTRLGYHKKKKSSSPSFDAILFCILVLQQCSCRRGVMLRGGVCSHWAIPSYRQETPPLIGRSPRLPSPSLRCRSDSCARFPLTTTLESKMVGGAWGATTRMRSFSVHVRGCIIVLVVLGSGGSTWAAKHFRSAESLSMQRQIQGPAVSVSVCLVGLGGRPHVLETHIGVAAGSLRDMRRRRERDFCQSNDSVPRSASCWPCSHRWHARFAGKYWKRSPDAVRGCVDTQGPKKGWPGTPSSQWWKRRRLSSRKVIATCRRGGLSPAVSPLCSDAGSTAAGGRRMFAMKQLQCRPSAALHSCLCMPSHPATTLSNPSPEAKGEGVSLARGLAGPTGATGLSACSRINGNC